MRIQKKYINSVLMTISHTLTVDNVVTAHGLLTEEISLGLKRRLQKIFEALLPLHNELQTDEQKVKAEAKPEELEKELQILFDECVEVNVEYASLSMIEEIKTKANYDFKVIEMFAK